MMAARTAEAPSGPAGEAVRQGELEQLEARRGHDVWDRLGRIRCAKDRSSCNERVRAGARLFCNVLQLDAAIH